MNRLEWNKLLSEERIRKSSRKKELVRNEFEADYDRIVGSSSVRRLQDKAQVFPLQPDDVVRTRLTHSIEVSSIAASLGKRIGRRLEEKPYNEFDAEKTEKLVALLRTVGLVHDLGNPPFGHYGEKVIQKWYKKWVSNENESGKKKDELKQENYDFLHFDGNVQNLRILTKLQTLNDKYGANFTCGTLSTIMKYPFDSLGGHKNGTKFGYYKTEEGIVEQIRKATGLEEGVRHPATYILEAADDITYLCDDIEDGVKKGLIPLWNDEYDILCEEYGDKIKFLRELKEKEFDQGLTEKEKMTAHVRFFRNFAQGYLIDIAEENFLKYYDEIMKGEYGLHDLLESDKKFVKSLKNLTCKYCFTCEEVLSLELVGDRVLTELLDIFSSLVNIDDKHINDTSCYEGKLYSLISDNYKFIYNIECDELKEKNVFTEEEKKYLKMHLIVDFISGMTDSYAVRLYKKLAGVSLVV